MSTKFLSPGWRMPRNANQSKQSNYSMDFDTSSTHIEFATIQLNTTKSVSFWVNWNTTITGVMLGGGSGNYYPQIHETGGATRFYVRDTGGVDYYTYNSLLNTNQWYHVCITGNGTTAKVYLDGSLIGTMTDYTPALKYINTENGSQYGMVGKLDAVCIFDYELSLSQITTLYGTGSAIGNPMALPRTPIAYYPLGESAGGFVGGSGTWLTENNAIGDYVFSFDRNASSASGNDRIDISSFNYTGDKTVSFWINWDSNAEGCVLGHNTNVYYYPYIRYYNNYTHIWLKDSSSGVGQVRYSVSPDVGRWYHYCITGDGTTATVYIDGVSVGTTTDRNLDINQINAYDNILGNDCKLSNVQIFNTALSGPEVETLYNYGSPIQTLANIPQNSNLKAWYKLDASEIYNGTSTKWEVNQALSFWKNSVDFNLTDSSANRAYIQCANTTNLNLTGAMTISAWMKGDQISSGSYNGLGTQGNSPSRGYGLLRGTNNAIFSISDNGSNFLNVSSPSNTWLDGWNHIVGVFDPNSRFELYVNGVFSASGTNYAQQTSTNPFQIGSRGDGSNLYNWLGQLSNVSIWNTALSNGGVSVGSVAGGEIATLYNGGEPLQDLLTGPQNSNLLSWWKLDNITTGIQDSKGTNNGTIVTLGNGSVSKFNQSVSTLNGTSSGMNQSNLVQSDLQTVAPYSKYALDFDAGSSNRIDTGAKILNNMTSYTASIWAKGWSTSTLSVLMSQYDGGSVSPLILTARHSANTNGFTAWLTLDGTFYTSHNDEGFSDNTKWVNLTVTWDGSDLILYVNGIAGDVTSASGTIDNSTTYNFHIGGYSNVTSNSYDGQLSNCSVWNTALTFSQVREIYNEGLPSNLNSHSAYSNLISWWQLGENSSFGGTNWICADEKGSNDGTSTAMPVSALTNGVGTTANGVSSGMAEGNLVGDAPYSDANAVSSGMAVQAFDSANPPNVISGRSEDVPS